MVIAAVNVDLNKIVAYLNIGLLVLFFLFIFGIAGAFWRGLKRGVWKSTHNMVFMFSLVIIAFATLDPLCKFAEGFNIGMFVKGSFIISKVVEGDTMIYYIPVTTVKETATEFIKGFYTIYNVSATAKAASNFAFAIVESVLKILLFIVDILLILIFGNIASFLCWILISKHFVPKVARKLVKLRWLSAIETAVTFIVMTAVFCMPLTSLVNSLNQSYQHNRPKSDNEIILNIGNFVDAYNDSLFAKILFNWSYNEETGMTLDTQLFNQLTTGVSEDVAIGLVGELANWTNLVIIGANGITNTEEGQITYNASNLVTKDIADSAFDVLANSGLLTSILPVVTEIALNSSVLDEYIPNRLIDLSDVEWKSEIKYVQDMVDSLFKSGVLDHVKEADYSKMEGAALVDFMEGIINDEHFEEALNVFKSIDDSKVLSRVVPAVTYYIISNDSTGKMKQYFPLSWEELNEFSWGYECYVLFDFLSQAVKLDDQFVKVLMNKVGAYTPQEGEELKSIAAVISENVTAFNSLIVGNFDEDGNPLNVDKYGRTVVFDKNGKIKDRHYCLFDMMVMEKSLPLVLDSLFELDLMKEYQTGVSEDDKTAFKSAVNALNAGTRTVNYKKEFKSILDVTGSILSDKKLLEALLEGGGFESLMTEPGNYFSIDVEHINHFKDAIEKMDCSTLLYSAITPIVKSFIGKESFASFFNDIGLRSDVIVSAINQDAKKENHQFFTAFASLLDNWSNLGKIYNLTSSGGGTDLMDKFKDGELVDTLVTLLNVIHDNPIINPTPTAEEAELYEKNENLYGLLEFVFGMTSSLGLTVTRETMRKVETDTHTWNDEFTAIGNIIKYIASHDVLSAADMFSGGLTRTAISNLKDEGEGKVGLPKLFELVDASYLFSSSLGPFLDQMFGDALSGFLVNESSNVSFANIASWSEEGQRIANLLESLNNLVPADDAEAKNFLTNFDLSKLKNIIELNDMLHQLANSGIFVYIDSEGQTHYQFGLWFYQKINDSMVKFSVGSGESAKEYDLLADPKPGENATWTWKDSWGIIPGEDVANPDPYFAKYKAAYNPAEGADTHYFAYRDFVKLQGLDSNNPALKAAWCDYNEFTTKQAAFLTANKNKVDDNTSEYYANDWKAYFASDTFVSDYDPVFAVDEISHVCKFMTYALRVLEKCQTGTYAGQQVPFNKLPISLLDGMLTSLNNTSCMRICIYNFYRIAAENLLNGYNDFDISGAYNIYMIDTDLEDVFDFEHSRALRQNELDILINFYTVIDKANKNGIIVDNNFVYSKLNENGFIDDLKGAFKGFNRSFVFHRSGSSKSTLLTPFQVLFNSILSKSSIKDVIYLGNDSPKDKVATAYSDSVTKVRYLVTETFLTEKDIASRSLSSETERSKQEGEIDGLLNCIDYIYSLKDKEGQVTTSINNADMNNHDNVVVIENLFKQLNNSNLLYDCLPNSIYNIFVKNNQMSIQDGSQSVDFKQVDPFYHYYFINTVERATPDYQAKYLDKDVDDIVNLLEDYQSFNTQLAGKQMSDPATLKTLTGENGSLKTLLTHMHDSNLFHSPARNYGGALYYTDKFDNDGYTLFEEMISKICSFVMLDEFAYDNTYAADIAYGSAANKLKANIKAVTLADDQGKEHATTVYHQELGTAWTEEVDSILRMANVASDLGGSSSSLDVSKIELQNIPPATIKEMLTAVNSSDIIHDAIPGFIKDGFKSINLGTLTTYNEVDYAYYRLGQVVYGGEDASSPEGSEIDNIYQVMLALYDENNKQYAANMNNITTFVEGASGEAKLEGLLKYIYTSHIFDTNKNNGEYHVANVVDEHNITAQGIMLYNSLGNDLSSYIARDANPETAAKSAIDRIATLSKIVYMRNFEDDLVDPVATYHVEAKGLKSLLDATRNKITASTFEDKNVQTIKDNRDLISNIISSAYNADGENRRSAIVSEFVSGLLNYIMENQYTTITGNPTKYASYQFVTYSFGNDDAKTLVFSDYNDLNSVERDGAEGVIDSLQYITTTATPSSLKAASTQLQACFTKMGGTPGNNSHVAQILYLSQAHPILKPFALYGFTPVNELSKDPEVDNNVYSNTFSFKEYGERIGTFLASVL